MNKFASAVKAFVADENGVTAIEYALIAALIGVGIIASATALRNGIAGKFTQIVTELNKP